MGFEKYKQKINKSVINKEIILEYQTKILKKQVINIILNIIDKLWKKPKSKIYLYFSLVNKKGVVDIK